MLAIGASSFGDGSADSRARAVWNVSSHVTSGVSRSTCRRFHTMPSSSTNRIRLFSAGLFLNASISTGDSSAATIADQHQEHRHAHQVDGGAGHGDFAPAGALAPITWMSTRSGGPSPPCAPSARK